MPAVPFKVKAVYEYKSEEPDDLNFPNGQIITVTDDQDEDWYTGEYTSSAGDKIEGLFPRNFVEKYEPAIPSRPVRTPKKPIADPPPSEGQSIPDEPPPSKPSEPIPEVARDVEMEPPAEIMTASSPPAAAPAATSPPASKPAAPVQKTAPPPVAEKPTSSSFKDRIAAFNKPAAAPPAPFKPAGSTTGFVKKAFVAPPPSKNSYVPPPREPPPQKVYRREEDPSMQTESAPPPPPAPSRYDEEPGDEDQPKPTSLKERIALLQKQQLEQANRHAEAGQKKEKPKKPPKRRVEPTTEEGELGAVDPESQKFDNESIDRKSMEAPDEESMAARPSVVHQQSSDLSTAPLQPSRELVSDTNDADDSGAGDTEDAQDISTEEERPRSKGTAVTPQMPPAAPKKESVPDAGDEEEEAEGDETEEEEEDPEIRRRRELRDRMAKMSGGMGMMGMFGGGMPGAAPPSRKHRPSTEAERHSSEQAEEAARAPPVPIMALPGMSNVMPRRKQEPVEEESDQEDTAQPTPQEPAKEVEAAEDYVPQPPRRTATGASSKSIPQGECQINMQNHSILMRFQNELFHLRHNASLVLHLLHLRKSDQYLLVLNHLHVRMAVVTNSFLTVVARPIPPPPPPTAKSPEELTRDEDSEDEAPVTVVPSRVAETQPMSPTSAPPVPPPGSRPPVPREAPSSPVDSPSSRPPPPPPPGQPPSRKSTTSSLAAAAASHGDESEEEVTEYDGDYDTDIASSAKHKDALKSHNRNASLDDGVLTDDATTAPSSPPVRAIPPLPSMSAPRDVPPPPPPQSAPKSRKSTDVPRAAPPPIPPPKIADEEDYDPYRYSAPQHGLPTPPPIGNQPPTYESPRDEGGEDYMQGSSSQPPRMPTMPLTERGVEPPMMSGGAGSDPTRPSLDVKRSGTLSRRSMEQPRPSGEHGMATDIDLAEATLWWTQENLPPPALRNRPDLLYEIETTSTPRRGGKTEVRKEVYILYQDYSQTTVTASYDSTSPASAHLEQSHERPPPPPRKDQLEMASDTFGTRIASAASQAGSAGSTVADGSPHGFVYELLRPLKDALPPVGSRSFGALVYANLANASTQQFDEIRPGDIVTFRNAKFSGHKGGLHQKYSMEAGKPDHVGVVVEWDGTKKKIRCFEQGREEKGKKSKVREEGYRVGDLRSGEVRVWRVMGRGWIGWEKQS